MVYMKNLSDEQFRRSDALIQQQNQVNALSARSRELENSLNQVRLTIRASLLSRYCNCVLFRGLWPIVSVVVCSRPPILVMHYYC